MGLAAKVAYEVKQYIVDGNLTPGDRLPSESELMTEYGVSRSSIREAIRLLRAENVVEIKKGVGTFVSQRTGIADDPLGLQFSTKDKADLLEDLLEARLLIEPEIAFLAAMRVEKRDIEKLHTILENIRKTTVHSDEHTMLDVEFHTAIARCTHNSVLKKVVPIICESIIEGYPETIYTEGSFERSIKSHINLFDSIQKGDALRARYEMEKHIRQTLGDIKKME